MKICRPFYEATPNLVTQRFGINPNAIQPNGHTGIDIVPNQSNFGALLVAPCKVKITNIVDNLDLDVNSDEELRRGYGIVMKPLEGFGENDYFLYWHCRPAFPVSIGDIVEQGEAVAQIGNSGYIMFGGQYVSLSDRNTAPYRGTHLHFEYFTDVNGNREYKDIYPYIDWTIPITRKGFINSIAIIISKLFSVIKK